jgi:hypothetical protein
MAVLSNHLDSDTTDRRPSGHTPFGTIYAYLNPWGKIAGSTTPVGRFVRPFDTAPCLVAR